MNLLDPTISLGNVLSVITILVTLGGMFWKAMNRINDIDRANMVRIEEYHRINSQRLTAIETKTEAIWDWFTRYLERRSSTDRDKR